MNLGSQKLEAYINQYVKSIDKKNILLSSISTDDIDLSHNSLNSIINLQKLNNARFINKYLEKINEVLVKNGVFIGKVETYTDRRLLILKKYSFPINRFLYIIDFLFNRLIPKLPITKKLYFLLTRGKNRVISKAEIFGRIYSCGFEIIDEINVNNCVFFTAKKNTEPYYDKNPTYGLLIKLNRVGKEGKIFNVYKIRTMHPFSEYLQEYVYKKNKLKEGGKINNDFRISPEGKFFRKFWIDELPMLYNLLKGDIKLIGVRPLSQHYFNLYNDELKTKRILFKPGLIPPFYADMPSTLKDIMISEMNYLKQYENSPFFTDVKYFFKAFNNIVFKRKRSN